MRKKIEAWKSPARNEAIRLLQLKRAVLAGLALCSYATVSNCSPKDEESAKGGQEQPKSTEMSTAQLEPSLSGSSDSVAQRVAVTDGAGQEGASGRELPPVLPIEESDVIVLPPAGPHRVLIHSGFSGTGATIIDGDDEGLKTIGTVPTGNGVFAMSDDGGKIYVAETYWTRGNRGDRDDLLSIYDGQTLNLTKEIDVPGRLLVAPKLHLLSLSSDGALAYIYDFSPASSVHVVDLKTSEVKTSIDIPGCAIAASVGKKSFASLCGDGTIGFTTLGAGETPEMIYTDPLFDADLDPIFENSVVNSDTGEAWFLSYSGSIYPVSFGSGVSLGEKWSITQAAGMGKTGVGVQELAWRPGGRYLMTMHYATNRIFVLMHRGTHWTHKEPGEEIWVLDAEAKTLVRRIPLDGPASSITVTQDADPVLFVAGGGFGGGGGYLAAVSPETGKVLRKRQLEGGGMILVPEL